MLAEQIDDVLVYEVEFQHRHAEMIAERLFETAAPIVFGRVLE
jgi:hypothetical protein